MKYTSKQIRHLIAGVLLMMAYGIACSTMSYFVIPVTTALGCTKAAFSLYYTIMSIAASITAPIVGRIFKTKGLKPILLLGIFAAGIAFYSFALWNKLVLFYFSAAIAGLIFIGATILSIAVIINTSFTTNRGTAMGIAFSGSGISGIIMGFVLPPIIEQSYKFGYVFLATGWVALLSIALILTRDCDVSADGQSDEADSSLVLTGASFTQAKSSATLYILLIALTGMCMSGYFLQHMTAYLNEIGFDTTFAGRIMSFYSFALMIFKILDGMIFDRLGPSKTIAIITPLYAIGFVIMMISHNVAFTAFACVMIAFGMASLAILPPLYTRLVFGQKDYAAIYGISSLSITMSGAIGTPAWGAVCDITGSYKPGLIGMAIILLVSGATLFYMSRKKYNWNE